MVVHGNLRRGMEYPEIKFAIISESDIFGEERRSVIRSRGIRVRRSQSFVDLSVGDYVVHENHGLGIYKGLKRLKLTALRRTILRSSMPLAEIFIFWQHNWKRFRNMPVQMQKTKTE